MVKTPTKRIDKLCKVDQETRNVICNLKGYKGYLVVSYLTRKSDRETWGDTYSKSEYQFIGKRNEEICSQSKSVRVFDKSTNSFVWRPENYAKDVPEKFSVVLWAGTVGIGMKTDGTTKELRRSESEAWAEFLRDRATKEPVESKRKINSIETERENACLGENIDFVGRTLVVGIVATVLSALIRVLIF